MDGAALHRASVPVLIHYVGQVAHIAQKATDAQLGHRLADGGFTAAQNFATAQFFSLRATYGALGRELPSLGPADGTTAALVARSQVATGVLQVLSEEDYAGIETTTVRHTAGQADLEQTAVDYVTLFALPNTFFHISAGYAILRGIGVDLGKADFDGLHAYAPGFRF